ncbi:MAG: lytic murein transglycosylase, partial [Patescibacteria group bacterium]
LADEKKVLANKIRSALFSLAGTSEKIEFGTALEYANLAKQKTGIDPAFLLAILTQESSLGANVGKCYLTDASGPQAGYGVTIASGKTWTNLMKATRDVEPFLEITRRLGLDPLKTVVSCPVAGVAGYGGAMGPAQFIPSTWKLFENRLREMLGYDANPWAPKDAFMASAMYLTDLGAIGSSTSAQNKAACRYYGSGGSSCTYSKSVQKYKTKIQGDIDLLSS